MKAPRSSIVRDRFTEFIGKCVELRTTWAADAPIVVELVDVFCVGSTYMLKVRAGKRVKLIASGAVLELAGAGEAERRGGEGT
jgi:hypothetical protein